MLDLRDADWSMIVVLGAGSSVFGRSRRRRCTLRKDGLGQSNLLD